MKLSVIICTYNPKSAMYGRVIQSLKDQTLAVTEWQLIIVDNCSTNNVIAGYDYAWHPDHLIVREEKPGLIYARICGTLNAKHEVLVSVDDDTPLFADYLKNMQQIYLQNPDMGVAGGRTVPEFEIPAPDWLQNFNGLLAIRDLGEMPIVEQIDKNEKLKNYPRSAPLLIAPKKQCMLEYIDHFNNNGISHQFGRKGDDLASGEDNDINLFIYSRGYQLGYFPQLKFIHLIPRNRLQKDYLGRLQYSSSKTWIKVLDKYEILPWPKISRITILPRIIKAWITYRAWASPANYIRWRGACGTFEALANNG